MSEIDRLLASCREAAADADTECPWCGRALPPGRRRWCSDDCRADFVDNHFWSYARARAIERDRSTCQRCGTRRRTLEVHHVDPRLGQGYGAGCHHHVDMLLTLCHRCHVAETNAQRRQRALGVPA
jgi:5-methylcytosine-specific restriction endonuclease McrA